MAVGKKRERGRERGEQGGKEGKQGHNAESTRQMHDIRSERRGEADGGRGAIGDDEKGRRIKHTHLEGEKGRGKKEIKDKSSK